MVVAAVIASGEASLTEQQVIDHCRTHVAGYKCPRRVLFVDELPRNATGKIVRARIRDLLVAAVNA
jgi:fatty-acyl-CoA synthase